MQEILGGLNHERISATLDQPKRLGRKGLLQVVIGGVSKRGEFGPWPHRAQHPAHPAIVSFIGFGTGSRNFSPGPRQFFNSIIDLVIRKVRPVSAKSVGFYRIDPGVEIGVVNARDDVGPGDVENFITALKPLEVLQRGCSVLEHGAHGAIGNDDAVRHFLEQRFRARGKRQ